MEFKAVPFTAKIKQTDSTETVANQMQELINSYVAQGWEYQRLENVETHVLPDAGCFGLGGKPGFTTSYKVMIFKK